MRTTAIIALTLAVVLSAAAMAQDEENGDFKPGSDKILSWVSYENAVSKAKARYKPAMLYFYGDEGRDLCKLTETKMFKNYSVKSQARKFLVVKVSSTDDEMTRKYKVPPGRFAIILLNFQFKELARITTEKELRRLATALKKAYKENSNRSKKLKKIKKAYDKAMRYQKAKRMRDCIKYLEAIAELKGKIDSPYIEQAETYLKKLEEAGAKLLSQAESSIQQAEQSMLTARQYGSSQYFQQSYVNDAQHKLAQVAQNYFVKPLQKRLASAQTRLASLAAEYQRMLQEEQPDPPDPPK